MQNYLSPKALRFGGVLLGLLAGINLGGIARAQNIFVVDEFDSPDSGITNFWGNWFGNAFESLTWDPTNDSSNNPASGSMEISLDFNGQGGIPNQFAVYDFDGIYPPVNGAEYPTFECDVRFAAGSATVTNGGAATFGYLQFGVCAGNNQDYFGGVSVPASNTNWFHVSLALNVASDPNLSNIDNILIHMYGPYYSPGLSGVSTLWVDNIHFVGSAPVAANCVVNWNVVHQRIDGFGASSAWDGTWTQAQADMFFSTHSGTGVSLDGTTNFSYNGIGLSLLRSRIAPGGTSVETNIMIMAQALGAKVWSTPWSPDPSFKSNTNVDGGNFLSASNAAYAAQLAGYVANMKNNYGINLYAVSVQNEPSAATDYESCLWTAQQIHDFVPYLQAALAASNVASTKILLAEDENWETNLYATAMSDPAVAANVGIVACHDYDGNPPSDTPAQLPTCDNPNAALWETEVSAYNPFDPSITNALYWATRVHLFMTAAQVNAFHFWWLIGDTTDNEGLTDENGIPAKRMYALGNYSRFIRPGFYRIDVNNNALTSVSAYKDPVSGNFAIVAINSSSTALAQTFNVTNFTALSVTPWITSATLSLASQAPIPLTNSSFAYALPAFSVVTFTGQGYVRPAGITVSSAVVNTNGFVLTWNSKSGASYSVLKTNSLSYPAANWPVLVTGYPAGGAAPGSLSYTDATSSATANFYQVTSP
jgi:glucuronoarabinoxylan endo-1,4-beta-xylanase